jgi:hypothetical protein
MSFDVNTRLSKLKGSARHRGININLDVNKYQLLINLGCHYCGSDLKMENGYCLDRVDNKKGYVISNIVGCCGICNRAKNNMNLMDFTNWLIKAGEYTKNKIETVRKCIDENIFYTLKDELELYEKMNSTKEKNRIKEVNG